MKSKASPMSKAGLFLGLAIFMTGCTSAINNVIDGTATSDELLTEKMNYYVDCVNTFSNAILQNQDYYLSWVDPVSGPTGDETYASPLYAVMFDPTDCIAGIETANAIDIENQFNPPAQSFATALGIAHPLIEEAAQYYKQENYKDDGFAKGKELHEPLMAAFDQFEQADISLRKEMDVLQKELDERLLQELEVGGNTFAYLHKKMMVDAEKLIAFAEVNDFTELDLEAFNQALETYEKASDELDIYKSNNEEEVKKYMRTSLFNSAKTDFLMSGKTVMRAKRDGTAKDLEAEYKLLDDMIKKYNDLISRSNSLNY